MSFSVTKFSIKKNSIDKSISINTTKYFYNSYHISNTLLIISIMVLCTTKSKMHKKGHICIEKLKAVDIYLTKIKQKLFHSNVRLQSSKNVSDGRTGMLFQ